MAADVKVEHVAGRITFERIYPKVDIVAQGDHALELYVKKYPNVPSDQSLTHVASLPYENMISWTVVE